MAQTMRVIGPPGTGKTSWIQSFVAGLPHRDVLLVSHTRAAAKVLAHRIDDIDPERIGTLHAMAYRALGRPPVAEVGKLARKWNEMAPAAWAIDGDQSVDEPSREAGSGDWAMMMRERIIHGHVVSPALAPLADAWQQFKLEHDAVDFADMLELPVRRGLPPPMRTRVLIVDEAQDLASPAWALVRHWSQWVEQIVVAGDPAQSIYEWAGADPRPLLETGWDEIMLAQSHRLPPAIHHYAEALLVLRHSPEVSRGRWYRPRDGGDEGEVLHAETSLRLPSQIVALCRDFAEEGTVMVLAPCQYQLRGIVRELRTEGLPFHNPYRPSASAWNPLRQSRQGAISTVDRALAFLRPRPDIWGDDARLWVAEDLAMWVRMLRADAFAERGARDRMLAAPQDLTMDSVAGALTARARAAMEAVDLGALIPLTLSEYHDQLAYVVSLGPAVRQRPRIIVGTIHSVKGGEADTVIVAPDLSPQQWWSQHEHADALARMFYVAVTRARRRVVVLSPSGGRYYQLS